MRVFTEVIPYSPFPAQKKIHEAFDNHRYVVINHGNRFGGTRCMIACGMKYFVDLLNEHRDISNTNPVRWVMLSPSEKLGKNLWRELKQMFPDKWVVTCSNDGYMMVTLNGGIIEMFFGNDCYEDYPYKNGADLFTVDCLNRFEDIDFVVSNIEVSVNYPGRGLAIDRGEHPFGKGKAIFCGTPNENSDYKNIYMRGQKDSAQYSYDWWSDSFPWTDNPNNEELSKMVIKRKFGQTTYAESLRERLGDKLYRMNYLAEFVE